MTTITTTPRPHRRGRYAALTGAAGALAGTTLLVAAVAVAPLWARLGLGVTAAVVWALQRRRPAGRGILGYALDLLADAVLAAVARVAHGAALGLGLVLVVVALGSWALGRVEAGVDHAREQVTSVIPRPSLPDVGDVTGWLRTQVGGAR